MTPSDKRVKPQKLSHHRMEDVKLRMLQLRKIELSWGRGLKINYAIEVNKAWEMMTYRQKA